MWVKLVSYISSTAFKYTFEGEIRIGLQQVDDAIELSVSDIGLGIPEDEMPRIFERFRRVERSTVERQREQALVWHWYKS